MKAFYAQKCQQSLSMNIFCDDWPGTEFAEKIFLFTISLFYDFGWEQHDKKCVYKLHPNLPKFNKLKC
jgi:hypothetical protein